MRKRTPRKSMRSSIDAFHRTLALAHTGPAALEMIVDLELAAEAVRSKFIDGTATVNTYIDLNHINCMTWQMARQISLHRKKGSEETTQIAIMVKEVTEKCADVLLSIGRRGNLTKKYGVTDNELKQIDEMLDFHHQVLGILDQGMITRAMIDAGHMVNAHLIPKAMPDSCS